MKKLIMVLMLLLCPTLAWSQSPQAARGQGIFCDTADEYASFVDGVKNDESPAGVSKSLDNVNKNAGSETACVRIVAEFVPGDLIKTIVLKDKIIEVHEVKVLAGLNATTHQWEPIDPPLTQYIGIVKSAVHS